MADMKKNNYIKQTFVNKNKMAELKTKWRN